MAKFYVSESATVESLYVVEADTEDDARKIVEEGFEDPLRTDYIEREIFEVEDATDDYSRQLSDDEIARLCEIEEKYRENIE